MGVAYPKLSRGVFSNAVMNWHIWMTLSILLSQWIIVAGLWCMRVHLSVGTLVSAVEQAQFPSAPLMTIKKHSRCVESLCDHNKDVIPFLLLGQRDTGHRIRQ